MQSIFGQAPELHLARVQYIARLLNKFVPDLDVDWHLLEAMFRVGKVFTTPCHKGMDMASILIIPVLWPWGQGFWIPTSRLRASPAQESHPGFINGELWLSRLRAPALRSEETDELVLLNSVSCEDSDHPLWSILLVVVEFVDVVMLKGP